MDKVTEFFPLGLLQNIVFKNLWIWILDHPAQEICFLVFRLIFRHYRFILNAALEGSSLAVKRTCWHHRTSTYEAGLHQNLRGWGHLCIQASRMDVLWCELAILTALDKPKGVLFYPPVLPVPLRKNRTIKWKTFILPTYSPCPFEKEQNHKMIQDGTKSDQL